MEGFNYRPKCGCAMTAPDDGSGSAGTPPCWPAGQMRPDRPPRSDFMIRCPTEWEALMMEKSPPGYNSQTWKRSIICKDLKDKGYSLNKSASSLFPGYEGASSLIQSRETQHHSARHLVQGDLKRLKKLQTEYLKIAFSDE